MKINKLKQEVETKFTEFMTTQELNPGTIAVPADSILVAFQGYAPTLPVTKASLGRVLSKYFLKRQAGKPQVQCYYLNKSL